MRETLHLAYASAASSVASSVTSGGEAHGEPAMLLRMMAQQLYSTSGRSERAASDAVEVLLHAAKDLGAFGLQAGHDLMGALRWLEEVNRFEQEVAQELAASSSQR